jgi:hypothetical protein
MNEEFGTLDTSSTSSPNKASEEKENNTASKVSDNPNEIL